MPLKRVAAVRHIHFEDLGSFAPILSRHGYSIDYLEAPRGHLSSAGLEDADLVVVLGGPIGAYEDATYPFLVDELAILERRLEADRPVLGICLGAQLIARALGARVYPSGVKEIGWGPIALTADGLAGPLRHLEAQKVLHWHGDTFDLPEGCTHLAATDLCRNQAFARGARMLALQFHPEVTAPGLEPWLVGHSAELAAAEIEPAGLRAGAAASAPALEAAAAELLSQWLDGVG